VLSKPDATIGDRVYIGRQCVLGLVALGDDVMLADAVQVLSGRHQHGRDGAGGALRNNEQTYTKVSIGSGAWLGAGSVVMADVGSNTVVGAGAVVIQPVPTATKVGGVPAKPLRIYT
jgi:acetyltransferase-like isoleucine patch superfamily enzyme